MLESLFDKVADLKTCNFLKRDSNTNASGGYYKIFKNSFFYRTPLVGTSDSLTTVQSSQRGCLFFDFLPQCAFDFDKKT